MRDENYVLGSDRECGASCGGDESRKESIGGGRDREGREDLGKGGNEFPEAVSKCRVRASHSNRMAE